MPHHARPLHRKGGLVIIDRSLAVSSCSLQSIQYLLQWTAAITESDSKRWKTERQMLLTSDGGPYLVSGIPGRWFKFLKRIQIFSSENWSQGGINFEGYVCSQVDIYSMKAEHIASEQHTIIFWYSVREIMRLRAANSILSL